MTLNQANETYLQLTHQLVPTEKMTLGAYRYPKRLALTILVAFSITTVITLYLFYQTNPPHLPSAESYQGYYPDIRGKSLNFSRDETSHLNSTYRYSRNIPLFFIGGMPRSGTTLLRVMMDSHPDVRCGGETRVIPRILNDRNMWMRGPIEKKRLHEAGVTPDVLDAAVGEFMLEIIVRHGKPAKRLCNKDPFTLKYATYIRSIFPNAQFLFMIRDGRAVAHSIVSRKVTISGFDYNSYRDSISRWNTATESMHNQCTSLGHKICLPVHYEELVLHPERTMRNIIKFLGLEWNDSVLHHEDFVNQPHGIELSKLERSTDQVIKPVNTEMLTKWVGHIPKDVIEDMAEIAPMLAKLGYDPNANPPNYGDPDSFVKIKMQAIERNRADWKAKEAKRIKEREELRSILMKQSNNAKPSDTSTESIT